MVSKDTFCVGDWTVTPERDQLSRNGQRVRLRRQVMELLVYLVESEQVVSLENILDDLWAGKFVTDGTADNCIAELRQVLGEYEGNSGYIETIPKRGYRLVAQVVRIDSRAGPGKSSKIAPRLRSLFDSDTSMLALPHALPEWRLRQQGLLLASEAADARKTGCG